VLGGWRLVRKVAESRCFVVHLAAPSSCDSNWPADYVLKFVQPALASDRRLRQLLERERQVSLDVTHPRLATVLDADLDYQPPFIVQPFYEGKTVRALLRSGALGVSRSLWIARQIAEAFGALHAAHWIHGDIKPDNVIVSPLGHATLVDLGFARRIVPHAIRRADTSLKTTLTYAAPELFLPQQDVTTSSDVYSLGAMLFELLTGRAPFEDAEPRELARHHLHSEAPDVRRLNPVVPLDVAQLVARMLAKRAADRPHSEQLVKQLITHEIEYFGVT
jgi:serine/threonine-protein kinase